MLGKTNNSQEIQRKPTKGLFDARALVLLHVAVLVRREIARTRQIQIGKSRPEYKRSVYIQDTFGIQQPP
eukprot:5801142-Amphidinium_carterae.1